VYAGDRRRQEFAPGSWVEETVNLQPGVPPGPGANRHSHQPSQPGISPTTLVASPQTLLPVAPDPRHATPGGLENNTEMQRPSSAADSHLASSAAPPDRESAARSASHGGALQAPLPLLSPFDSGNLPPLSAPQRNEGSRAETTVPELPQPISRAEKNRPPEEPRRATSALSQKPEPRQPEPRKLEAPKPDPLLRLAQPARPPGAGPQLAKNRPPQEPEIQVHIGRIEVIAAAPQPPRVPSPRPNRATSLADYLAGRNGRS